MLKSQMVHKEIARLRETEVIGKSSKTYNVHCGALA
jgi:hypothetical protein